LGSAEASLAAEALVVMPTPGCGDPASSLSDRKRKEPLRAAADIGRLANLSTGLPVTNVTGDPLPWIGDRGPSLRPAMPCSWASTLQQHYNNISVEWRKQAAYGP